MRSDLGSADQIEANKFAKIRIIGYGTFLKDAIKSLAAGIRQKVWNENVNILGPVKVVNYRRLWPGATSYPVIQKADGFFFFGVLFEIDKRRLARFDQIEGVPMLYTREKISVHFEGELISVFIYVPSEKMLNHVLHEYELNGKEPGFDDWANYLRDKLSSKELDIFPEIFFT